MTRTIYVYDSFAYLTEKLCLEVVGDYKVAPPNINLRARDISGEHAPEGVQVYAPQIPEEPGTAFPDIRQQARRTPEPLPDIFAPRRYPIVSEDFMAVVQDIDPGMHKFFPCLAYGEDGRPISSKRYYHFWIERIVKVTAPEASENPASNLEMPSEFRFVNATQEIGRYLADLPIWTERVNFEPVFFSQEMRDAFKAAGLTGLEEYEKSHEATREEDPVSRYRTVGQIWLDAD